MILKQLTINNLFAYKSEHSINFSIEKNKNLILILARNGRGKTSFLRIVRILIHGIRNNKDILEEGLTEREYAIGKSTYWRGIFNADALQKGDSRASVYGVLELEGKELKIHRRFIKESTGFQESSIITYDGQERSEDFLENILPKNFAQFFFFDGEKIESLINTKNLNVEESLKTLLNIKAYERLIDSNNLGKVKRDLNAEVQDAPTAEQIKKIDAEIVSIKANLDYLQAEMSQTQKLIKQKNQEVDKVRDKLYGLKATDAPDLKLLKRDFDRKKKELADIKKSLVGKLKGSTLPVLLAYDLTQEYLQKLNDDNVNYQLDEQLIQFKKLLKKIKENIFEEDEDKIPTEYRLNYHTREFYEERMDKAFKKFTQGDQKQMEQQLIYFHEEDKKLLNQILQEAPFTRSELKQFDVLKKEVSSLREQIEVSQGDDEDKKVNMKNYQSQINVIEEEKSKLDQKVGELKKQHTDDIRKKTELENQIIDFRNQFAIAKPIKNTLNLTEKLLDFFNDFIKALLKSKVDALQREFSASIRKLLPDDRIHKVKIDHRFNIKIYNKAGHEQAIGSLSSGQKQIVATALMQAISNVAKIDSFVCVDTPLARIDKINRERIIKYYYPFAAKQVIILATDSEVALESDEYQLLEPYLAKSYTILNSYKKKSSYFEEGYALEKEESIS